MTKEVRAACRFLSVAAGLILLLPAAYAAPSSLPGTRLRLDEAVRIGLEEHPEMSIAASSERIASSRVREARSAWLPAVEASQSYTRGNNPVFVFGSLLEQGRFGPSNFDPQSLNNPPSLANYRAILSIRYPLFDQWRRVGSSQEASYGLSIAAAQSSSARQSLTLRVLRAFYGALLAEEEQRAAAQAVQSAEADVKRIQDRVDTGLLVLSDLLSARVQLAAFREREIAAAGELAIARRALAVAVGRPHQNLEPVGSLAAIKFPVGDLDELLATASQSRSDLRTAALEEKIAASRRRTADAALLPRVDAFANWGASGQTFSEHNSDHTAGLVATWRIPSPAVAAARTRAAEERNIAAAHNVETTSAAELEIATAWEHARAAEARTTLTADSIAQADEALRIVRDRYEQGLTPITEVLRARTALVEARLLNLHAIYDHYLAYAQLLQATGRLESVQPFQQTTDPAGAR